MILYPKPYSIYLGGTIGLGFGASEVGFRRQRAWALGPGLGLRQLDSGTLNPAGFRV